MGRNLFKEKMEQLAISESVNLKAKVENLEALLNLSRLENAGLKERLRLVRIASQEGE